MGNTTLQVVRRSWPIEQEVGMFAPSLYMNPCLGQAWVCGPTARPPCPLAEGGAANHAKVPHAIGALHRAYFAPAIAKAVLVTAEFPNRAYGSTSSRPSSAQFVALVCICADYVSNRWPMHSGAQHLGAAAVADARGGRSSCMELPRDGPTIPRLPKRRRLAPRCALG